MKLTEKDYKLIRDCIDNSEIEMSNEIKEEYLKYEHLLQSLTIDKIDLGDSVIYFGKPYLVIEISDNYVAIKDELGKTNTMTRVEFINRKKKELFEQSNNKQSVLKIGDYTFDIPEMRLKLLIITNREPKEADFGVKYTMNLSGTFKTEYKPEEPSAIYPFLPIKYPANKFDIVEIKKKPSYKYLTPEQRWIYFNWLRDISQPIDINYVFLYYYGLERHLIHNFKNKLNLQNDESAQYTDYFLPNIDLAIDEIIELRKYHHDYLFQHFSLHSVFYSLMMRKQTDLFWNFFKESANTDVDNIKLLMAIYNDSAVTSEALLSLLEILRHPNYLYKRKSLLDSKYIYQRNEIFKEELDCLLEERYGSRLFPVNKYSIKSFPQTRVEIFINYSIPQDQRSHTIPDITALPEFISELREIMFAVDQKVKMRLRSRKGKR
jgi:hypothetical protein